MAEAVDDRSLSLYFELKPGEKADLEVVAQAAIHWVETLRSAARAIDPDADVRVELIDANEGSLRLNTVLEWLESQIERVEVGSGKYPRLRKLAIAAAIFIPFTVIPTYDYYFGDHTIELSQEDRQRMDTLIQIIQESPEVKQSRQEFFRTLEGDPAIKGIGISEDTRVVPKAIIPSDQFAEGAGLWSLETAPDPKRTIYPKVTVRLITPKLINQKRYWSFQPDDGLPAFSARMEDQDFLDALEEKGVNESLRIGIPMTLLLKVEEVFVGGVWEPRKRSVIRVLSPRP